MIQNMQKCQYLLSRQSQYHRLTSVNLLISLYFTLAFHAVMYNLNQALNWFIWPMDLRVFKISNTEPNIIYIYICNVYIYIYIYIHTYIHTNKPKIIYLYFHRFKFRPMTEYLPPEKGKNHIY